MARICNSKRQFRQPTGQSQAGRTHPGLITISSLNAHIRSDSSWSTLSISLPFIFVFLIPKFERDQRHDLITLHLGLGGQRERQSSLKSSACIPWATRRCDIVTEGVLRKDVPVYVYFGDKLFNCSSPVVGRMTVEVVVWEKGVRKRYQMRRVNSLWCKSCSLLHRSPKGSPDTFFLRSKYACTGFDIRVGFVGGATRDHQSFSSSVTAIAHLLTKVLCDREPCQSSAGFGPRLRRSSIRLGSLNQEGCQRHSF